LPFEDFAEPNSGGNNANIGPDSLVFSTDATYPDLNSVGLIFSIDPVIPTADAEAFYFANFDGYTNWTGNAIGVRRKNADENVNQILFTMELYNLNGNPQNLETLFDRVLNDEFNW